MANWCLHTKTKRGRLICETEFRPHEKKKRGRNSSVCDSCVWHVLRSRVPPVVHDLTKDRFITQYFVRHHVGVGDTGAWRLFRANPACSFAVCVSGATTAVRAAMHVQLGGMQQLTRPLFRADPAHHFLVVSGAMHSSTRSYARREIGACNSESPFSLLLASHRNNKPLHTSRDHMRTNS